MILRRIKKLFRREPCTTVIQDILSVLSSRRKISRLPIRPQGTNILILKSLLTFIELYFNNLNLTCTLTLWRSILIFGNPIQERHMPPLWLFYKITLKLELINDNNSRFLAEKAEISIHRLTECQITHKRTMCFGRDNLESKEPIHLIKLLFFQETQKEMLLGVSH